MLRLRGILTGLSLLFCSISGAAQAATLDFSSHGFRLEALTATSETAVQQVLMLFLPASDGFAPNVNVQTQPFEGDMAAYIALSRQQLADLELELLDEEISDHQMTWSYQGLWQGLPLRWYSRAILDAEARKVFLVTGTALKSQWPQVAPAIKRCVESLELLPSERSERSGSDAAR